MQTLNTLAERTLLVGMEIKQWGGEATDRDAMDAVAEKYKVSESVGKVVKELIDPSVLKPIRELSNKLRTTHRALTLPWLDNGPRIIVADYLPTYNDRISDILLQRRAVVDDFCQVFDEKVREQAARLKDMFREDDYPSNIRERFDVKVDYFPTPTSADFRAKLSDGDVELIRQQIESANGMRLAAAERAMWDRLKAPIQHMYDVLSKGDDARIYDTLISNIADVVETLPMFNVSADPNIGTLCADVKKRLLKYKAGDFRQDKALRKHAAADAQAIVDKMAGYMNLGPIENVDSDVRQAM